MSSDEKPKIMGVSKLTRLRKTILSMLAIIAIGIALIWLNEVFDFVEISAFIQK